MKGVHASTLPVSLATCLGWALASDRHGHTQKLAWKPPAPPQQISAYISLTRIVSLGSPSLQDRLRKQLAFAAPAVEARKRTVLESMHWIRQPEWFPGQLTLSRPRGGPHSSDLGHVLPFREND